jgi:hypothetical protein
MLALLAISTALAVVTPDGRDDDPQEETAVERGPTGETGATGPDDYRRDDAPGERLIEASVKPGPESTVVRAEPGDRLVLSVTTEDPAVVEIPDLGLTGTTSDHAPAVFDLLVPEDPETIEVTTTGGEKPLATIRIGDDPGGP